MENFLLLFVLFCLGACFGSFIHAWVYRKHHGQSIFRGRSKCIHTEKALRWFENIPLVSFILQGGRSRYTKERLSYTFFLAELGFALGFCLILLADQYAFSLLFFRNLILFCILGFTFFYDLKFGEIHDAWSTLPAVLLLPFAVFFGWQSFNSLAWGILIGFGFFFLQYMLSKGRWIGGGDVRLGFFMGVILGFPGILVALMLAYVGGALVSLVLVALKKKTLASQTPFGTYLSIATFATLLWGTAVIDWYLRFLTV
ncbi:MAG: hypothetical protein COV59_03305 [Candidatus Magasanikbacteria bacterium CG11_big_fil_rev_8_21_14_0_20_39_34]|uniref:Prepilin type IV endopeptidase peptidase domain-containing protein n=1 Tax=Candidatus Magasanikbacteria bacterium CG11_big_fil_rev_8_21_14_0_20_39_34 TaxID=1974653 RepID=A0A2H0N7S7_9BACT|nr:MAG: hypothetical protein COV59_03305 [Candidatus Magasanikbacteria bacterium CG11_big_fil_rev_8_21_14_0_20_39_34]